MKALPLLQQLALTLTLTLSLSAAQANPSATNPAPANPSTPEEFAVALYAPYQGEGSEVIPSPLSEEALPTAPTGYLNEELGTLVAAYLEHQKANPEGLGFDVLIDGQDYDLTDLAIHDPVFAKNQDGTELASVVVSFKNFGEAREIQLSFHRSSADSPWKLANITANKATGGPKYDLLSLLKESISGAEATANDEATETMPAAPDQ